MGKLIVGNEETNDGKDEFVRKFLFTATSHDMQH